MDVECVAASACRLGEGPCWSPVEGRLYWFDIKGRTLHWHAPDGGPSGQADLGLRASAAAACVGGGLIVATDQGIAHWDPRAAALRIVVPIALPAGFRTNDGGVDPSGAFWWTTMDDDGGRRPGAVFRTSPSGVTERMLEGVHIPNTVAFSADGRRLLLADSMAQTIYAHDPEAMERRTEFAHTRGEAATPDGGAMDAEGCLWNAQWGGRRVIRYMPDGRVDRVVAVPVEQPTSCAFGGPDLRTLFITSAWDDLSAEPRAAQPLAGALFALNPGVAGEPLPLFDARALVGGA